MRIRRISSVLGASTLVTTLALLASSALAVPGGASSTLAPAVRGASVQVRELAPVAAPFNAPRVVWPGPNQVALTFDDGPCATKTRRTVDTLGDTVATFFVIGGQVRRSPSEAQYAASRGHSIQNHTMDHIRLRSLDATNIAYQLALASQWITSTVGMVPTVYRPPYGSTDDRVRSVTRGLGWSEAMWNGGAPRMESGAQEIIGGVRGQMRRARAANHGLMLLFHDCSGNFGGMITALPTVIADLRADGWEFVAIA
jgi:peptidoglycan/xylan/chitin deacetylase (PgdA/CDA1 family)